MNPRIFTLVALLAMAGCATHDPATTQHLNSLEARFQEESGLHHAANIEIGKNLNALSAEIQHYPLR